MKTLDPVSQMGRSAIKQAEHVASSRARGSVFPILLPRGATVDIPAFGGKAVVMSCRVFLAIVCGRTTRSEDTREGTGGAIHTGIHSCVFPCWLHGQGARPGRGRGGSAGSSRCQRHSTPPPYCVTNLQLNQILWRQRPLICQ